MIVDTDMINDNIDYNYSIQFNNNYNIQKNISQEENVKNKIYYFTLTKMSSEEELYLKGLCKELNFDFHMVLGLIELESRFSMRAIGKNPTSKDIGYMQLNTRHGIPWAEEILGYKINAYDSFDNLAGGMAILYRIRQYYKNKGYSGDSLTKMTLLAYNRGIYGANEWIKKYDDYHAYVYTVLDYSSEWKEELKQHKPPIKIIEF